MNNKTWSCERIQTWSSLHELSEIKKDCYKACIHTYQIGDGIKAGAGVHLRESSVGSGPQPFFQTDQTVPSILESSNAIKSQYILIF